MTNLLIETELQQIEKDFGYDLGKNTLQVSNKPFSFLKFDERLRNEASTMASHYQLFYCLERSIRELVSQNLCETFDDNWWNSAEAVPPHINEEVKRRIQKEQELGVTRRSDLHIDYTTFGELKEIIIKNWATFNNVFTNQRAVERVFKDLIALRNPIAHCCPLAEDEIERLALTVKDWFRLMERK